jgi:hypothetical protein
METLITPGKKLFHKLSTLCVIYKWLAVEIVEMSGKTV